MSESTTILLVEDDDQDRMLVQGLMEKASGAFKLQCVGTLSAGLRMLERSKPDAVLLDLNLPDSQGLETVESVLAQTRATPIIVLTGLDDAEGAEDAIRKGAQDYLLKSDLTTTLLERSIRYAIDRKQIAVARDEQSALLSALMDYIPDNIYFKDTRHRFTLVNPALTRWFALRDSAEAGGKTDFDFFTEEHAREALNDEAEVMRTGHPLVGKEEKETWPDGRETWVSSTKIPLFSTSGQIVGVCGISRDITRRKEAELALEQERRELEVRVSERTVELTKAMAQLQEHDRARTDFVSNVSHELNTPLAAIDYATQNLLRGIAGELPQRLREYVGMIRMDCERLKSTIEDVLYLSRIEAKSMALHRRTVDLCELTRNAVERTAFLARAKDQDVALHLDQGSLVVSCDPEKVERVLVNVIRNAIKFTPEKGHVGVNVSSAPTAIQAPTATVRITDDGIGIAPEHLPRVTERYFRGDESKSGTGLGLSICKEIMELHGGVIHIQSPPPGKQTGTDVYLCLPIGSLQS